ncbi:MAG TPA: hypothetical protein VFM18_04370 [Methanosarcina sp.]|nr:hypothetical protein [Methanosarcina sp.]
MNIKSKLKLVVDTQKEIFDYFGYEEGWHVYPIEDRTEYFWGYDYPDTVAFSETNEFDLSKTYEDFIVGQYPKDDFTLIIVNTQCDGNSFAAIFDNTKFCGKVYL